jgi:hypothetical protein
MSGILLTYKSAISSAHDAANMSMRAACRKKWSRADADVYTETLDRLAIAFFRAHCDVPFGPVDIRQAHYALSHTHGMSVSFSGAKPPQELEDMAEYLAQPHEWIQ